MCFTLWSVCGAGNIYADNIKAVATFSILGDVVKNVAGNHADVSVLVGPDGSVHEYEPTPQDTIQLSKADIIVENGLMCEHWLDKMYTASGSKALRVVASTGVAPLKIEDQVDPHAWQDVNNVIIYAQNVRDGLMSIDPMNAQAYKANAQKYIEQLRNLDGWIKQQVVGIRNKTIVTNHDALGYFANQYGFTVIGAVIPSATTEAADPSAMQTAQLLETIKAQGVKVIFAENIGNSKLAKNLAESTGVTVAPSIYTDSLGEVNTPGETYISMMRWNVKVFLENLK